MFFCGKKTVYLAVYYKEQRQKAAGFLQISQVRDRLKLVMNVRCTEEIEDDKYHIFADCGEELITIGTIDIKAGKGFFRKDFCTSNDAVCLGYQTVGMGSIRSVGIVLTEQKKISGCIIPGGISGQKSCLKEVDTLELDCWKQILCSYPNVHPFGDERIFVSLDLPELMILPKKYHILMHNSFLLHGFYNYRHLILGKDYKAENNMEKCFCLGVPGVYFERERQVAVMFGFDGFECEGAPEHGKFGYYVKEVLLF